MSSTVMFDQAISEDAGTVTCWSDSKLPSDTPAGARRAPSPQEIVPGAGEDRALGPLSHFTSGRVHPNFLFQLAYAFTSDPKANFAIFFILQIWKQATGEIEHAKTAGFNGLIRVVIRRVALLG